MFVKPDPLGGLSHEKRLQFFEDYLSTSTEEASKLAQMNSKQDTSVVLYH